MSVHSILTNFMQLREQMKQGALLPLSCVLLPDRIDETVDYLLTRI